MTAKPKMTVMDYPLQVKLAAKLDRPNGDGGKLGRTKSTNDGTWNWKYHGTTEGQPGQVGPAIVGVAPLTTQLINGGKILQTL
ncbi:hypothetical protein KSX25_14720 [Acinetobacter baumannii]|nr:hypothetical protein [Acinetobacter baumannii]